MMISEILSGQNFLGFVADVADKMKEALGVRHDGSAEIVATRTMAAGKAAAELDERCEKSPALAAFYEAAFATLVHTGVLGRQQGQGRGKGYFLAGYERSASPAKSLLTDAQKEIIENELRGHSPFGDNGARGDRLSLGYMTNKIVATLSLKLDAESFAALQDGIEGAFQAEAFRNWTCRHGWIQGIVKKKDVSSVLVPEPSESVQISA